VEEVEEENEVADASRARACIVEQRTTRGDGGAQEREGDERGGGDETTAEGECCRLRV
jgi:hypothetical protein